MKPGKKDKSGLVGKLKISESTDSSFVLSKKIKDYGVKKLELKETSEGWEGDYHRAMCCRSWGNKIYFSDSSIVDFSYRRVDDHEDSGPVFTLNSIGILKDSVLLEYLCLKNLPLDFSLREIHWIKWICLSLIV